MTELNRMTVAAASRLLASGEISAMALFEAHLAAIARFDGRLRSFVTLTEEAGRSAAARADDAFAAGKASPLLGIPYGLKDVFETKGVRTTAQSRSLADYVPRQDCHAATTLAVAGAVLMGKTATWEFAHGGPSWDVLFPPARNPWDLSRSPAGSSSGSAAAVAAGLLPFALGTDTGGSIRTPAAVCGVVGLKPTYGRVSRHGAIPNSFSQDHVGPITRTVEDAAIVLQALAGHDPRDPATSTREVPDYTHTLGASLRGVSIGVPFHWFEDEAPVTDEVRRAFEDAVVTFTELGAAVVPVRLPPLSAFEDVKKIIALADLYALHGATLRKTPELLGKNFRGRIAAGALLGADDYVQAQRLRGRLQAEMMRVFASVQLLMLPMAEPAPPLVPGPSHSLFSTLAFAAAFNVTGNPAISVPSGMSSESLPLALQLVARPFDEALLLNAGHAFERAHAPDYVFPPVEQWVDPGDEAAGGVS